MNKRGFTLIELLAVIVILAIILAIAIPSISGVVEVTYSNACDINLGMMKKATKNYIDFGLREPPLDNEPIAITIDELRSNNMITAVVDPKDRTKTCEGYVVVKKDTSGYIYTPYIKCESDCLSAHYGETDIDMMPPVITITGSNPITINVGDTYIDLGATATDNVDGDITISVVATSTVNTSVVGTYAVIYTVSDSVGNSTTKKRTVYVVDSSAPVITLLGANPINSPYGVSYTDPGATAIDSIDGDITDKIVIESTIDVNTLGTYTVTYTVSDKSGNQAVPVVRTINIVDTVNPVVTFSKNGDTTYTKSNSTDVNITDNVELDTSSLKYLWSINSTDITATDFTAIFTTSDTISTPTNVSGGYYLWILAKDTSGNIIITHSNVFNLDNEAPTITMFGSNNISILHGEVYSDAGVTATDNIDGDITDKVIIESTVNVNKVGMYTVTYNVSDNTSNTATPVVRTVYVVDISLPVIAILGANPISIPLGSSYTDPGATASDNTDGDITDKVNIESTVNVNTIGTYTVTYNVSDSSGNAAIPAVRTVNVIDVVPPTVNFSPNGNTIYAKTRTSTVTVSDNVSVNAGSLKYQWTTSVAAPTEESFTTTFTNDGVLTSPAGVTEIYYLWILAKDTSDNTTITHSNAFNLDNTKPVITMNGNSSLNINVGTTYTDAGATAIDNVNGDITSSIMVTNNVNASVVGTYTVTYNVSDSSDNTAISAVRTVNVTDNNPPTVAFTPNGNSTYAKTRTSTVSVSDNVSVNTNSLKYQWTTSTTTPTEVSFSATFTNGGALTSPAGVTGTYYLWILAKDNSGNTTIVGSNAFNLDNTKPVITINGSGTVSISQGAAYTDAGATAIDNVDGNITGSINTTSTVNPSVVGTYTVTYNASDSSGNAAISVVRTVYVVDVSLPVITILGANPISVILGSSYTDAGATAFDNTDGDITSKIVVESNVNVNVVGTYTVTYNVSDDGGNTAIPVVRTVNVVDNIPPTVAFVPNGNTTYVKTRSTTVTVSDNIAVNTSSLKYQWTTSTTAPTEVSFATVFTNGTSIGSSVGVTGGYYLWILAKDTAGNMTITRSNIFNLDNTKPVITMNGSSTVSISQGTPYTDAGATATDNIDGNITSDITITNNVNINVIGTYTVTYNVSDSSGNTATTVSRTVNVTDGINPTVAFSPNGNATYAKTRSTTVTVSDNVAVNTSSLRYQWTTSTTAPTEASFATAFTNGTAVSSSAGLTGGYYLWILAKDTLGNTTITRSNIFNLDNTKPVITISGSNPVTILVGSTYSDAGATASDNVDGNITGSINATSTVNPNVIGTYTVTYDVSDSSGNAATSATRTVNVVDTTNPVVAFSPNGSATPTQSYSVTVTVTDNVAVNASSLKYIWNTSTTAPTEASFSSAFTNGGAIPGSGVTGNYYLWILAKDTSGNTTIVGSNAFNFDNTDPVFTYVYIGGTGNPNSITGLTTTVYSSVSGATQMCMSATTSCSAWEAYATTNAWTFTGSYGVKTIYAWYKDAAGNQIGYYTDSVDYLQSTHTTTYTCNASGYSYAETSGWTVSSSTVIQGSPSSGNSNYWGVMYFDLATIKAKWADYSVSQIVFTIYNESGSCCTTKATNLYVGGTCPTLAGSPPSSYTITGGKPTALGSAMTIAAPGSHNPAVFTITDSTWINNLMGASSKCLYINKGDASYYWEGMGAKDTTPPKMVITWVPR